MLKTVDLINIVCGKQHDIYFENTLVSRNLKVTAFIKNTNLCNIINVTQNESTILFISKNKKRTDPKCFNSGVFKQCYLTVN